MLRNTAWLAAERIAQFASGLLVGAYVARYLGVSQFGVLTYASAFGFLLVPLAVVSQPLVVRDLVLHPERENELLGTSAVLGALTLLTTAGLTLGTAAAAGGSTFERAAPLLLIMALGFLAKPLQVVDFAFQARVRSRQAIIARTTSLLITALLRLGLALCGAPLWSFAVAVALDGVLSTSFLLAMYAREGKSLRWRTSRAALRALGRESAPLLLATIGTVIYLRIDQVMLGSLAGSAQTGLYSVAVALSEAVYFLPVVVTSSVTPYLTRLHTTQPDRFLERLQALFTLLALGSYVLMLPGLLLIGPVVKHLYGEQFAGAVTPFNILIAALPAVFLGVAQSVWNTLEHHQILSLVRTVAAAGLNIGLNIALLPRYGATGAAFTTLVAQYTTSLIGNAFARPTRVVLRLELRALFLRDLRPALALVRDRGPA